MRSPFIFSLSSSSLPCISFKTLLLIVVACLLGGWGLTAAAQATVSPTSVTWSKVAVGQAGGQKVVTLTNTGSSQISISSIAFTGTAASDFDVFSKTCGSTLAASASCTANIIFKPTTTGTLTATLNFTDSASGSPQQVPVSGTGTSAVAATPASLSFGGTVGSTSASQGITVTNSTASSVALGTPGMTGTGASDFGATTTCGSSLAASSSCTASVDFKPTTSGTVTASWNITAGSSPLTVALSGTAAAAGGSASASPTSELWGNVAVGSAGGQKVVTLTNSSSGTITVNPVNNASFSGANPGDFSVFSTTCGSTLAASASCTASIIFKPTTSGTRTATLNFTDSASNSPQQVAVSGTGTNGTTPGAVTVSVNSLSFGTVQTGTTSSSQSVTVNNGTTASVTLSAGTLGGTAPGDFGISATTCGSSLAASASCTASIDFKPVTTGTLTASWSITSSASTTPLTVALSGTGSTSSGSNTASVSKSSLSFGSVAVNATSSTNQSTLINTGSSVITVSSATISGTNAGDFYITKNACKSNINPGSSGNTCFIQMIFAPSATGTRTATLTFVDSASNSPQTVALTGTGLPPATTTLTITPSSQVWTSQNVGTTAPTQTFTLTGGGSGSLTFNSTNAIVITGADPGDFSITGNTCGSTLAAGSSCTVTVAFKPTAIANRVANLTVNDNGMCVPVYTAPFTCLDNGTTTQQIAQVSGTGSYSAAQTPAVTVDFGSRSGSQVAIPSNILGTEYLESLPTNANRTTVAQGGFTAARYRLLMPTVFPSSTTPNWGLVTSDVGKLVAAGVRPIIEVVETPVFLQPSPAPCPGAGDTSVPTNVNEWGQLVSMIVQHFDQTFPGKVQYYEIWNEPNTLALCSKNQLNDYLTIYAAAAPQMKAQNQQDIQANSNVLPIKVGGPGLAGVGFSTMLTSTTAPIDTAPYVDFYSYHVYEGGSAQIKANMTWDGAGGTPSLFSLVMNSSSGVQARFLQAYKFVLAAKTPLGAKTPIYYDEYNDDWAFLPDCCRNDPTYSPLFNSVVTAQLLNAAYNGANTVVSNMTYFAAAQPTFCILGIINPAMTCNKAATGAQALPYPQWYAYGMIFAPSNLDLQDGGHMATSVTLSSGASSEGLIATAFYTNTTDSILIANPTSSSFSGVTLQINNSGKASPASTLYSIDASHNLGNFAPSSWPATTISASGGTQATFDVPAHSVLAISLK